MSITIYPSQFNMREDGSYVQLPAIKGEPGEKGEKGDTGERGPNDWVLVWQNASPSSNFAAQTISLDLSQYSEIRVVFRHWTGETLFFPPCDQIIGLNARLESFGNVTNGSAMTYHFREFSASATGIVFQNCTRRTINSTATGTTNENNIPVYIYAR